MGEFGVFLYLFFFLLIQYFSFFSPPQLTGDPLILPPLGISVYLEIKRIVNIFCDFGFLFCSCLEFCFKKNVKNAAYIIL